MNRIIELAKKLNIEYLENEPMSAHTTFKIGGNARLIVMPESEEEISLLVKACNENEIRCIVIGRGSNLLVSDNGIDACVILLGDAFSEISMLDETTLFAQSGASLMKLCRFALENELTGLEFAYGIPGSCGGAAFMNAGAYGGEIKDVVFKCSHIDKNGDAGYLEGAALDFSYRHSAYENNGCIITGIYIKLEKGDKKEIKAKMEDLIGRRRDKQPTDMPSAGSTFKRPEKGYASALIDECGLKGCSVGGAKVSEKHAGFVINKGGAKCSDVIELCEVIAKTVEEKTGIKLEMEVKVTE